MSRNTPTPRGFTLIELMIATATIGVLASVAIPEFQNLEYRSKLAERGAILGATAQAIQDVTLNSSSTPINGNNAAGDASFNGPWNPDANPGPMKRPWVQTQQGWNSLGMIVSGSTYCSYFFSLDATTMMLTVVGDCDLDGDGIHNTETQIYQGLGNAFVLWSDTTVGLNAF